MHPEISEHERFQLLTAAGRKFLHAMREDANAPVWNWPNGEQLDEAGLDRVQRFAGELRSQSVCGPGRRPEWLTAFVDYCLEVVPFYRRRSKPGTPFESIPSSTRDDLATKVWDFVPDCESLDRLIVFSSSGTTGHPAKMPSHPVTAACGIPLLEHILTPYGLSFPRGVGNMALVNIAAFRGAYTTAIVVAYLSEAGCLRVNLRPEDWRTTDDCRLYLERWHAPLVLGDPIAFAELSHIPLREPPKALISSILSLSDALSERLQRQYGCPVLDVYALTEAGIVAVKMPAGHAVVPHDLYVEILDDEDQVCPPGVRGEVTLTGGRNPFAPLLRYRTGDFASLAWQASQPVLVALEGRSPVLFAANNGQTVHSMEISRALRKHALVQFTLHQYADQSCQFAFRGDVSADDLRDDLLGLLGHSCRLTLVDLPPHPTGSQKWRAFSTDLPPR